MLSDELNASVTPVRDALHRLTGERLLEAPRQQGFRAPVLTESLLRHLYAWHLDLLLLAVMKQRVASAAAASSTVAAQAGETLLERQNALFVSIARLSANPEHVMALQALAERLEPVRRIERLVLDDLETETEAIVRAIHNGDRRALRGALVHYHRRRERAVPELLASLQER